MLLQLPRRARALTTSLAALAILASSLTRPAPGGSGPPVSGFGAVDEVRHLLAYAVLGLLVGWALLHRRWSPRRRLLATAGVAFLWGLVVEAVQLAVAYRTGSPVDAAFNLAGALLGAAAWLRWGQPRVEALDRRWS